MKFINNAIEMFIFLLFPDRCVKCLSTDEFEEEMDTVDGYLVTEFQVVCRDCGHIKNYWAYGYYEIPSDLDFWNRLEYCQEQAIYEI